MSATPQLQSFSLRDAQAFRLHSHHLDRRASRNDLVGVVRDTGGIQSQVPSAAELALRARVRGLRQEDIRRALEEERTLVRGWMVRFTVHVIAAEDFLLYARALSARVARTLQWLSRRGRPGQEVETVVDAIAEALADGPLTRRALADRVGSKLGERVRKLLEHSWGGSVVEASLRGLVCFGPERGNQITFASRSNWLPSVKDYATEEAGDILVRRYLRAFGPATPQDFQRWAGIPMPEVHALWTRMEGQLTPVLLEQRPAWIATEDFRQLRMERVSSGVVRLLPSFDAYLLGHRDKAHLVDPAHYKRVYRKAGWLSPVVLIDGRVAGVWTHKAHGGHWKVAIEGFRRLTRSEREGIAAEAEDLGRFLGGTAEVSYGP